MCAAHCTVLASLRAVQLSLGGGFISPLVLLWVPVFYQSIFFPGPWAVPHGFSQAGECPCLIQPSSPALGSSGHSAAGKRCSCAFANYFGMSTLDLILLLDVASFGCFWSDVTGCRASRALGSIGCKTLGRAVCTIYPERAFS